MRYIIAGYVFVLAVLALYAVLLVWRRRRLARDVERAVGHRPATVPASEAAR